MKPEHSFIKTQVSSLSLIRAGDPTPACNQILSVDPFKYKHPEALSRFLNERADRLQIKGIEFEGDFPNQDSRNLSAILDYLQTWLQHKSTAVFFSLTARLEPPRTPLSMDGIADLAQRGLKMMHWIIPHRQHPIPADILWRMSKQGIWNHLAGPQLFNSQVSNSEDNKIGAYIANNPRIVHSFQDTAGDAIKTGANPFPASVYAYEKVTPLPGIPAWRLSAHPVDILLRLAQSSQEELACLRWDVDAQSWLRLGENIVFYYHTPDELPFGFLDEIGLMVAAGGSVDSTYVNANLKKAYLIGYAMEHGVIVGNSCLKHPREAFIQRLEAKTGLDFRSFVERGYTSVRPEYRFMGIGRKLLEGLTARAGSYKVFSIIDEQNLATQKIAIHNQTRKIASYFSPELGKQLGVWMPAAMAQNLPLTTTVDL